MEATAHAGGGFVELRPGMILLDRPRTPLGTFAPGDTEASPADMTAAYPAAMLNGSVLAAAQKLATKKG